MGDSILRKGGFIKTLYKDTGTSFAINLYGLFHEPEDGGDWEFTVKGNALPEINKVVLHFEGGSFKEEKGKDGRVFRVLEGAVITTSYEETPNGAETFLLSIRGIGKKTAKIAVSSVDDVFKTLSDAVELKADKTDDNKLPSDVKKLKNTLKKAAFQNAIIAWEAQSVHKDLFNFLAPRGFNERAIHKIIGRYGNESFEKVKENPYVLSSFTETSFLKADAIAMDLGIAPEDKRRIEAAVYEVLYEAEYGGYAFAFGESGSSYLDIQTMEAKLKKLLGGDLEAAKGKTLSGFLVELHKSSKVRCVSIKEKTMEKETVNSHDEYGHAVEKTITKNGEENVFAIFSISSHEKEKAIAEGLASASAKPFEDENVGKAIEEAEKKVGISLNEKQSEAIKTALTNPVSLITGGAGTGKTTTLKCLIETLEKMKEGAEIVLLAPTGRAAKRMTQATGRPASTIHKALHMGVSDMRYREATPMLEGKIEADLLVVDETSMVDNSLMANLLMSVEKQTRLLFLGDTAQLPSVGPGSVLRDMIESGAIPVTKLLVVQRQAMDSPIYYNATIVRRGQVDMYKMKTNESFCFVACKGTDQIANKAKEIYLEETTESLKNVCLLSPRRTKVASGSDELNRVIQDALNPIPQTGQGKAARLRKGDKVMYTKNEDGLANGEIGYITDVRKTEGKETEITVLFEDGQERDFTGAEDMSKLVLAYAMSVHKSQGSEYETVILVMDPSHSGMLWQSLVYTAITRAKKKLIIVGSKAAFFDGVKRKSHAYRKTRVASKIAFSAEKKASLS